MPQDPRHDRRTLGCPVSRAFCRSRFSAADWPVYRGDLAHSSASTEQLPATLNEAWVYAAPEQPKTGLPGDEGRTVEGYVLVSRVKFDDCLHAVSATAGSISARRSIIRCIACDGRHGRKLWTFFTGGPVRLAPSCRRHATVFRLRRRLRLLPRRRDGQADLEAARRPARRVDARPRRDDHALADSHQRAGRRRRRPTSAPAFFRTKKFTSTPSTPPTAKSFGSATTSASETPAATIFRRKATCWRPTTCCSFPRAVRCPPPSIATPASSSTSGPIAAQHGRRRRRRHRGLAGRRTDLCVRRASHSGHGPETRATSASATSTASKWPSSAMRPTPPRHAPSRGSIGWSTP